MHASPLQLCTSKLQLVPQPDQSRAAMGQVASVIQGRSQQQRGPGFQNMDLSRGVYLDGLWQPGPPVAMDSTKFVPEPKFWWSLPCTTKGCQSWIYLAKPKNPDFQKCALCGKPWVQSFQERGPHLVWSHQPPHGQEELLQSEDHQAEGDQDQQLPADQEDSQV